MMGDLVVRLGLNSKGFTRGLDQSKSKLGTFTKSVVGGFVKIGAVLGTAVAAALSTAVFKFAAYGDQLDKMAGRTGFTTNALSELGFAAEQSGSDINTLELGIKGMQKQLLNAERGLSTSVDSLKDLGMTYADLEGLSPEDQFMKLAGAIGAVEDPSKKAALAMSVFGKAGNQLVPLFSGGIESIEELRKQARDLGISMSPEDAKAAAEFTDTWNSFKKVINGVVYSVGGPLIKVFTRAMNTVISLVKTWKSSFASVMPSFGSLEEGFLKVTLGVVQMVNQVTHFFVAVIPAVLTGFSENWKSVFLTAYDYVKTIFLNLGKNISSVMGSIWDYIASGGKNKLELAWTPLTDGFKNSLKEIEIPQRLKTDLEKQLELDLVNIGNKKKDQSKDRKKTPPDLGKDGAKAGGPVGAALKGSTAAYSSIVNALNSSKGHVQEDILAEVKAQKEEQIKANKETAKIWGKILKATEAGGVTGGAIS